jgi:hypothetical protein
LADLGEEDLDVRVDAARAGDEAAGLLVPVRVVGRLDDAEGAGLRHLCGEDPGEVCTLLARGRDVGDEAWSRVVRLVVGYDGNAARIRELGRGRVVAARLGNDELRPVVGELLEDRRDVFVARAVGDEQLGADRVGGRLRTLDALLVPPVVVRLLRSDDAHLRNRVFSGRRGFGGRRRRLSGRSRGLRRGRRGRRGRLLVAAATCRHAQRGDERDEAA